MHKTVQDPELEVRQGQVRQTLIKAGGSLPKIFFRPFGPQFGLKIWGGGGGGALQESHWDNTNKGTDFRFNPLGPKSDQHQFSSIIISRSSRVKVMRITKLNALILNQIVLTVLTGKVWISVWRIQGLKG